MHLLSEVTADSPCRGGFLAIGNFDGVHRGHQRMAELLAERAQAAGVPSVVMTFDPPPAALLRPDSVPPSLSTLARKTELLGHSGVDYVVAWPTDRDLLSLGAAQFFDDVVVKRFAALGMVEGPNFFFGRGREGDVELLAQLTNEAGMTLDVVKPLADGGQMVSSSRIRSAVADGKIGEAVKMLGHPYQLTGTVSKGAQRGATLGFPTANLESITTLIPSDGVYAGVCQLESSQWPVALSVGTNPTFQDGHVKVEAHVVGWSGNLYSLTLSVDLLERVRETRKFSSAESLKKQIHADVETVKQIASKCWL